MAVVLLELMRRRQNIGRNRVFRDRMHPLDAYDDEDLYMKFRFRRHDILAIVDEVSADIEVANRLGSLPPTLQVFVALRYFATGSFQTVCADLFHISQPTTSRIISRVTRALLGKVGDWICFPNQQEADRQKMKFRDMNGLPNVFGCIDGTLIPIQAPSEFEHEYICRKNYHALNVQVVCNADLLFIDVYAQWPGSVHDARVLRESALFASFERPPRPVEGVLLGDSGYMLREWLFTPIRNPANRKEERFNFAHMSTRSAVERALGVAKRRWACLRRLRLSPAKCCEVITVCFMLSNRARLLNLPDTDFNDEENDDDGNRNVEEEEDIGNATERARTAAGRAARDRIVQQFF